MMSLAEKIAFILDGKAEFARGGGSRKSAKGKSSKKAKGVTQASKGGACCKTEGGKFAPGNNYGSLAAKGNSQRAAANRVKARLELKSKAGKAEAASKAAASAPKAGLAGLIQSKSKGAVAAAAKVKVDRERKELDRKQARNKAARERRAAKKAEPAPKASTKATGRNTPERNAKAELIRVQRARVAQARAAAAKRAEGAKAPPPSTKADRAAGIRKMVEKSRVASGKAGAENARRKREAASASTSRPAPVAPPPASIERRPISDPVRLKAEVQVMDKAFDNAPGARNNFVTLADLKRTMPHLSKDEFIAVVNRGRDEGKYTLDSHEGITGPLTPELRSVAIHEGGRPYVYIRRRDD